MATEEDKTQQTSGEYLNKCLRSLLPTGPVGFEGLIRDVLEVWTGLNFRLARSGSQQGHDIRSDGPGTGLILVETKRFQQNSKLDGRSLA